MITKNKGVMLSALLIVVVLIVSACGPTPEPQVIEREVTVVVEGTPVVQTVVETQVVER